MIDRERRILLGEIGAAHGIRGEVSVRTFTSDPKDIAAYGALSDAAGRRTFTLSIVRVTPKGVIARIDGYPDRTAVEQLRNTKLYVARSKLPPPAPDEFYHEDLIGLTVVDPEGSSLGTVTAVLNYGAGDLIEIARQDKTGSDVVPFTRASVPKIDFETGRMTVEMPAYIEADPPQGTEAVEKQ